MTFSHILWLGSWDFWDSKVPEISCQETLHTRTHRRQDYGEAIWEQNLETMQIRAWKPDESDEWGPAYGPGRAILVHCEDILVKRDATESGE